MRLGGILCLAGGMLAAVLAWPTVGVSQEAKATIQEEALPAPAQSAADENLDPVRFDSLPPVSYPLSGEEISRLALAEEADSIRRSGILRQALGVGDKVADFELPMGNGANLRLNEMLAVGPVVVTFYRGHWSAPCNRHLQALQGIVLELHTAGAQLVAIGPEVPEQALATQSSNRLAYPVVSDKQNTVARQFGVVYRISPKAAPYYGAVVDLAAHNGDQSYELPLAATYVIGGDGTIQLAIVEADCEQRIDPQALLDFVRRQAPVASVSASAGRENAGSASPLGTNP